MQDYACFIKPLDVDDSLRATIVAYFRSFDHVKASDRLLAIGAATGGGFMTFAQISAFSMGDGKGVAAVNRQTVNI